MKSALIAASLSLFLIAELFAARASNSEPCSSLNAHINRHNRCFETHDLIAEDRYFFQSTANGGPTGSNERSAYLTEPPNAVRRGDKLILKATKLTPQQARQYPEACAGECLFASAKMLTSSGPGGKWSTGEYGHGYLEVVAQMPHPMDGSGNPLDDYDGLWSAIWLLPQRFHRWPYGGEINISEWIVGPASGMTSNQFLAGIHNEDSLKNFDDFHFGRPKVSGDLSLNPYVYGFEWQKRFDGNDELRGITFTGYFGEEGAVRTVWTASIERQGTLLQTIENGALVNTQRFDVSDRGTAEHAEHFYEAFILNGEGDYFLIINNLVGGSWPGDPGPGLGSATLFVNSVVAYKLSANEDFPITPGATAETNPILGYHQVVVDAAERCTEDEGEPLKLVCMIRATPLKCEPFLLEYALTKGRHIEPVDAYIESIEAAEKVWTACNMSCADTSFWSRTFGECKRDYK